MVLEPSLYLWQRSIVLSRDPATFVYDDNGEQAVWRRLFPSIHELPAGFGALRCSNLSAVEWQRAHLLHDPNLLRKSVRSGWRESQMDVRLKQLDEETDREMAALGDVWKGSKARAGKGTAISASKQTRRGRWHGGKRARRNLYSNSL